MMQEQMGQMGQMVPLKALRGRPRLANQRQLVSIRYSPEVLDYVGDDDTGIHKPLRDDNSLTFSS